MDSAADYIEDLQTNGRLVFTACSSTWGVVTTLDDLAAREYVESDALDLDHLSSWEG